MLKYLPKKTRLPAGLIFLCGEAVHGSLMDQEAITLPLAERRIKYSPPKSNALKNIVP